jgi:hypothetical protein
VSVVRDTPTPLLQAALQYASRGWSVLPVRPGGKEPLIAGGVHAATTDRKIIQEWWSRWPTANVGIACGTASGLVVLDADDPQVLKRLAQEGRHLPPAPTVRTARGVHLYFACPAGGLRSRRICDGVEVKAEGAYVLAPPSRHPCGALYHWVVEPGGELPALPSWILEEANQKQAAPFELPPEIYSGERNNTLTRLAGALRRKGIRPDEILETLRAVNRARCRPPLHDSELEQIARSAARWAPGEEPSTENADPWQHARPLGEYLRSGQAEVEFYEDRLIAPGCVTEIFGPRGCGKSEFARHLAVELARRGLRVLYLDRDNPPRVTRKSFAAWLRPGEELGDRLHVLDRNHAPSLLAREAWRRLPPERYDVIVLDSLDATAEGVGEQDSSRPAKAIAALLDLARKENGPAVLVLGNVVKSGTHGRGSGVIEDRADIVIEARDATGLRPTGKKPWFQELPEAGRAAWADRAARRAGCEALRLALVPTKCRVGEEPEPWAVELDFRSRPYACRDVTAELEAAARQALDEARRAQQEAEDRAARLLAEEVRRRAAEGRPMFKRTEAEPLLHRLGLTWARARGLITERAGALWRLEATTLRGARAFVLLPTEPNTTTSTVEGVPEPAQEEASSQTDRGGPHVGPPPWLGGAQIQSVSTFEPPPTVEALQEEDLHGRVSGTQARSGSWQPWTVDAVRSDSNPSGPSASGGGGPPGPDDLDLALAEYRAHVEACPRCSWTEGPRCETGHRLRAYHAVQQQALRTGTLTHLTPSSYPPGPGWALPDLDPGWFLDDPDPGDPEEEPPDWPDAWPEADPVEVVV